MHAANWQRAGRKSAPKPQPTPRPGVKDNRTRIRGESMPVDKFDETYKQMVSVLERGEATWQSKSQMPT